MSVVNLIAACAPDTLPAVLAAMRRGMGPMRAERPQPLSTWAAENFYLSAESSQQQGRWRAFPFQVGLLDWMADDRIDELAVKKSKRVGYTKMLTAYLAYNAAHRRRNVAVWQPTDDDRDSFVKMEIEPLLRDVQVLADVRAAADETIKLKQFLGSAWHLLGGKAARAYRRITVQCAVLDEIDAFDQLIEGSVDPVEGARGRLEGAAFPKLTIGSTPRLKGLSHVDGRYHAADVRMEFRIDCPHCSADHGLYWGGVDKAWGFKWTDGDPATVRHLCPHCVQPISQADYLRVAERGEWVSTDGRYRFGTDRVWRDSRGLPCAPPRRVGAHIWSAYSPQVTWADIVQGFLEAHEALKAGREGPMMTWRNEVLGEVWELTGTATDEHVLMQRAEPYKLGTVPRGALVLVVGIDVQDTRFEAVVWGIGRGEEMWVVDYQVFAANPADDRDWDKLDAWLATRYPQDGRSTTLGIDAVAIDTGGHFTHQVYNFARLRERRRVFAVRGASRYGQPIKGRAKREDVNWRGQIIKRGVKLWEVGTDTAKDLLHGRLRIRRAGPGCLHFSSELTAEFYEQLTAEQRVLQRSATGDQYRWVKRRPRNEALDCTVYALFALQALDLHRYTDAMWTRLEQLVEPPPDLFCAPVAVAPVAPVQAPAPNEDAEAGAETEASPPPLPPMVRRPTSASRPAGFGREW